LQEVQDAAFGPAASRSREDRSPTSNKEDLVRSLHSAVRQFGVAAAIGMVFIAPGIAQEQYPNREVKIIVPFPAGGGTDLTARYLAEALRKPFGQSLVVDNRPGASGMIGTGAVAKATPDGYTLLVASGEMALNPHLYKPMAYDWEKDLAPITNLVIVANVLVVHMDVPAKSVRELIAYAKNNPGKLTFSSSGVGNPQQLTGELFNKMAGVKILHVPYKGAAPQVADVAGKHITMTFSSIASTLPFIEGGKLRPIGVTSLNRVSMMPDVPTIAETLPGFELVNFFGFYGPHGLPDAIMKKLNSAAVQAYKTPELVAKLKALGFEPAPNSPEQFRDYIRSRSRDWEKIIIEADIKLEQ
jgi:tripartite-type tricarboxylate transporter receptor subunit TctC